MQGQPGQPGQGPHGHPQGQHGQGQGGGGGGKGKQGGQGGGGGGGGQRRGSWRGPGGGPNGGGPLNHGPGGGGGGGGGGGLGNRPGGGGGTSGLVRLGSSPNNNQSLRTDTDISSGRGNHNNRPPRDLQPWGAPPPNQQQQPGGGGPPLGGGHNSFPALGTNPSPTSARPSPGGAKSPSPSPLAGLINAMNNTNNHQQGHNGSASPSPSSASAQQTKSQRDAETFGALASEYNNGSIGQWDQFATNAKLFGTRTDYADELYTTTLKKGQGKEWEEKIMTAERLEREIMTGKTDNPHLAEERGQVVVAVNGEEMDEEDKYSGVKRKTGGNAYVPPALRRVSSNTPAAEPSTTAPVVKDAAAPIVAESKKPEEPATPAKKEEVKPTKTDSAKPSIPVLNVTGTDGDTPKKEGRTPEKLRTGNPRASESIKGDIQGFVEHEKEKLQKQRETMQNMAKAERERKLADLKKFGATFKIPGQKSAGGSLRTSPEVSSSTKLPGAPSVQPTPKPAAAQPVLATMPKPKVKMVIPEIPPFHRLAKPKPEAISIEKTADIAVPQVKADEGAGSVAGKSTDASAAASPATANAKLNPGASTFVFKPNPKAADFKPTAAPAVEAKSPAAPAPAEIPPIAPAAVVPARNPFFGGQVPKRTNVNVRDDFNPFKGKVGDAKNIPNNWPFAGKKFLATLHPTGAYMTAPPLGMEEEPMHAQGHPGAPMMSQFAMGPNGPFPPYRVQHQGGFPVPGSPAQPGMVNGHFAPYGPAGGFYVPQGGPVMGAPGTPNGFPQGLPPFANNPGNQSPMMVANAMLRPTGNPVYYVQPPVMSHPVSPHPYPATPQSVISNHPGGPSGPGGPGPNA